MENSFIDKRLADRRRRLQAIHSQIDQLKLEAVSVEGEIRAYEEVRVHMGDGNEQKRVADPYRSEPVFVQPMKRDHQFQLSPAWRDVFTELATAFPSGLTRKRLKEAAARNGQLSKSFHASLYHHLKRELLDRRGDLYFANERTAGRVGLTLNRAEFSLGEGSP